MFSAKELETIISKLSVTIDSIEHQAICLGEDNFNAMWDENDIDNWTSMEANLIDVKRFLEGLRNDTARCSN